MLVVLSAGVVEDYHGSQRAVAGGRRYRRYRHSVNSLQLGLYLAPMADGC